MSHPGNCCQSCHDDKAEGYNDLEVCCCEQLRYDDLKRLDNG